MAKRTLLVGDVHATVDDLADCELLADLVVAKAQEFKVDTVVFLGDQYHTHAIMHVEVMAFWKRLFKRLEAYRTVLLLGNHDRPGDSSTPNHALLAHLGEVTTIVADPTVIDNILYLPYYHDNEAFVKACNAHPNLKVVVCHQSFNGGKYENGMYMEDGVDPSVIPQESVISGHIHTPQRFSKVWYPGAPRWRSLADANVERSINVIAHADDGTHVGVAVCDTGKVCSRIVYQTVTPEQDVDFEVDKKDRIFVDVRGPEDFVKDKALELKEKGVRVRKFPTLRKAIKVRESEGVQTAFVKFVRAFVAPNGTSSDVLEGVFNERLVA